MRIVVTENWGIEERPGSAVGHDPLAGVGRGLTWIGVLYAIAKASVVFASVLAGRWLGTTEYGRVNLVLALSTFLTIALTMGFPLAISKFVAEERDRTRQRQIVSTAIAAFFVWALAVCALVAVLSSPLSRALSVPEEIVFWTIAYSFCNSLHSVVGSPLLGQARFSHRGAVESVYGLCLPVAVGLSLALGPKTYSTVASSFCAAFLAGSAVSVWVQRREWGSGFHPESFRRIWQYAALGSLGLLSTALVVAPARLVLHRSFSAHEVGIFSAYFNSTAQISLTLLYMAGSVLVPIASRYPDAFSRQGRLRSLGPLATTGLWLAFSVLAAVSLQAFGRQYPFRLGWIALFSAAATMILLHGVCAAVLSARDVRGLGLSIAGSLTAGFSHLALTVFFTPRHGVGGAALSLLAAYLIGLAYFAIIWPRSPGRPPAVPS